MKKLIAYFSASDTTKKLAERLQEVTNADIFEIKPAIAYTNDDLDWTNKNSRSSLEMKDLNSRPEILEKAKNMDEYDVIYVGFPIWWYVAPTIINTFLEQYDLTNKAIIPFATSGGSDMRKTNKMLEKSCKGANLLNGKRFSSSASKDELKAWAERI